MPLNLTNIDFFFEKHREAMNEKVLLCRERTQVLTQLEKIIPVARKDYKTFEAELPSFISADNNLLGIVTRSDIIKTASECG